MNSDLFMLEGRAYSWRALCEQRTAQLQAMRKARGVQPTLFPLKEDQRPSSERTGSGRYLEPSLLDWSDHTRAGGSHESLS